MTCRRPRACSESLVEQKDLSPSGLQKGKLREERKCGEAEERETDRRRKGNALRGIVTYYQERKKRMIGHKEGAARDARRVQGRAS